MPKIFKSLNTTISEHRTIQIIPMISASTFDEADDELPMVSNEPEVLPEDILKQAKEEAERIIAEAKVKAESAIESAKQNADSIIADAKHQEQNIMEAARKSGYQAGYEDGMAKGQELYQSKINQAIETIHQFELDKKTYILQHEQQLLELVCTVAKKVIHHEFEHNENWVVDTVKSALSELVDRSYIEIHMHPDDVPFILEKKDQLTANNPSQVELHIQADPSIERGGCILRTRQGSVDARIDTQVNEVRKALLEAATALHHE